MTLPCTYLKAKTLTELDACSSLVFVFSNDLLPLSVCLSSGLLSKVTGVVSRVSIFVCVTSEECAFNYRLRYGNAFENYDDIHCRSLKVI